MQVFSRSDNSIDYVTNNIKANFYWRRKMISKEQVEQIINQMEKYKQKAYIFICNPAEQIKKEDLPNNIRLARNPFCELGKGYLMEDDLYAGLLKKCNIKF